jgi:ABC-type antimicrobial peptide transport system permease subunit
MPLLLALFGALFASWVAFSRRLEAFSVLRALGMTRRQITGLLLWEQSLLYLVALLIGAAFGYARYPAISLGPSSMICRAPTCW